MSQPILKKDKALDASVKGFDDKTQQRAIRNKDAINIVLNSSNTR